MSSSCEIYSLPAGSKDLRSPEDEVSKGGRAFLWGAKSSVSRGSILYVSATFQPSFIEIEEDVTLLGFFKSGGPSD